MARYRAIYLLLFTFTIYVSSKETDERISLKPPDKLILEKSSPYQEEGFFSRITNWFTSSDSVPAEDHHSGPKYLPPQPIYQSPECHPCNKAPWVPIVSNVGHNTLVNFVPPPSSHSYKPSSNYGPPPIGYRPPLKNYGPPNSFAEILPSKNYGPPAEVTPYVPRPQKLQPIEDLRPPPPTTYLQPIRDNYAPTGMRPPPLKGRYHSLPLDDHSFDLSPPPPPPVYEPIPLPNLSLKPLAPIHDFEDFHHGFDSVPQQGEHYEVKANNVQVIPSLQVANYLASIEHPINVIQSPLVDLAVEAKLSENPIVVEDTYTAASAINISVHESNSVQSELVNNYLEKKKPVMDYSDWTPSSTWLEPVETTTKKQIQIIVPYVMDKSKMVPSTPYSTLLPVYSPPSTNSEVWTKFAESKVPVTSTPVYNIRDLLKDTKEFYQSDKVPFDVISLQNNIDDWTQQSYGHSKSGTKVVKMIPDKFLTTPSFDHEQAGSSKKETKSEEIETNLITKSVQSTEKSKVTEKVYIVTPAPKTLWSLPPKIQNLNDTVFPTPKFLVRVEPEDEKSRNKLKGGDEGPLTVVFSEWPHLINNLQTTTTQKSTSQHPLLGLMDLSQYTPPPNSSVETISGHSKVVTVVTAETVTEKNKIK